jgi:hypothetical protein
MTIGIRKILQLLITDGVSDTRAHHECVPDPENQGHTPGDDDQRSQG